MNNINNFTIEEYHRGDDPLVLEVVTYKINDRQNRVLITIESYITLDEKLDSLIINKVAIPVDPDEPVTDIPATLLAGILTTLADEGLLEPGKPVHLDNPGEYLLPMNEPYRIVNCYYQKKYEQETNEWLQKFLVKDGTIARSLEMIDSDEEK